MERLVGALEQLQVPLAQVREALGIEGMDVRTALNVRDKSQMKEVLQAAGHPVRPARARAQRRPRPLAFADQVGFPLVAKPPAGAGAQATFRLDDGDMLRGWLAAVPPGRGLARAARGVPDRRGAHLRQRHIGGATVWSSIADYRPPPLEVLRNPWIQWTVAAAPRHRRPASTTGIHRVGPAALQALGVTRRAHAHGVVRPARRLGRRLGGGRPAAGRAADLDARLRARLRPLPRLGRAGDPRPVRRRPSAGSPPGTAYLRGMGRGRVRAVHGIEAVQQQIGHLVVEARLPQPGQPAASDYLGEGYVIVRDPDTAVVRGRAAPDRRRRPRRAGRGLTRGTR